MILRRHGAAVLVATFLVGQLLGIIHQLTVQHSRCPEHGELIHAGAVDGPSDGVGDGVEIRGFPQAPRHEHDPCELSVASRERMAPIVLSHVTEAAPDLRCESAEPPAREAGASLALYRTAPKTSPPA